MAISLPTGMPATRIVIAVFYLVVFTTARACAACVQSDDVSTGTERAERELSTVFGSVPSAILGTGFGSSIYDPTLYVDDEWRLARFVLADGYRYQLDGGTLLNNSFIYPARSVGAFSPVSMGLSQRGIMVLRDAFLATTCSAIADYISYYGPGAPGAQAVNITVLDAYSFYVPYYDFNSTASSTTAFRVTSVNMTYGCIPGVDESSIVADAEGSSSDIMSAIFHQISMLQRSTNVTVTNYITWGTGPGYNNKYKSQFNGSTWPADGLRLMRGSYDIYCDAIKSPPLSFSAIDGSSTPTILSLAPGVNLSFTNAYVYGMCAQPVTLPSTLISFNKNQDTAVASPATAAALGADVNAATINVATVAATTLPLTATVLPQALPLWPFRREALSLASSNKTQARVFMNASTVLVSEQEASTLHYLAALQRHALAAFSTSVQAAVVTSGVAQLAALTLGSGTAGAMLPRSATAANGLPYTSPDLAQLDSGWLPPTNLTARPLFAAYSVGAGVIRMSWSPTGNGAAMRDVTVGAMEPAPGQTGGSVRSPSWLPYLASTNTYYSPKSNYATHTFCNGSTTLANSTMPLFSPPLLTVGGLSPTTPSATRAALLANSSYVAANAGAALAAATTYVQDIATIVVTGSASYLPPVILVFADSPLVPGSNTTTTTNNNNNNNVSSSASANAFASPMDVIGPMILAGPVPPPSSLPTSGNNQLVPGFAAMTARPALDLTGALDALRIVAPSGDGAMRVLGAATDNDTTTSLNGTGRRLRQINQVANDTQAGTIISVVGATPLTVGTPVLLLQRLRLSNLIAKPLTLGRVPTALPLWAIDRPGRNVSVVSNNTDDSVIDPQLLLTSVTVQVPAAEFAALCALARLAAVLPYGQTLPGALAAMRATTGYASSAATSWPTMVATSLSATATDGDVFLAALSHDALNGVTNLVSPVVTTAPSVLYGNVNSSMPQALRVDSYAGWGVAGSDVVFVPDAPVLSLSSILTVDISTLSVSNPSPSTPGSSPYNGNLDVSNNGSTLVPPTNSNGSGSHSGLSTPVAVGIAVAIGFSAVVVALGAVWMLRRWHRPRSNPGISQLKIYVTTGSSNDTQHVSSRPTTGTESDLTLTNAQDGAQLSTRSGTDLKEAAMGEQQQNRWQGEQRNGRSDSKRTASSVESKKAWDPHAEINALVRGLRERGRQQQQQQQQKQSGSGESAPAVDELNQGHAGDQLVLNKVLGRGASGTVYEGSWKGLTVAVKAMIIPDDAPTAADAAAAACGATPRPGLRKRAITEAAVCCSMAHPNVVSTYHYELSPVVATAPNIVVAQGSSVRGAQAQDWKLYLVQELCDASLSETLTSRVLHGPGGTPHMHLLLPLLRDVASGMAYLHSRDIIHGDLKPDNVLLKVNTTASNGVCAKVTDFGLCVTLDPTRTHISNCRSGTPYYVAPEVVEAGRMTKAADVYSFGVLAWQTLLAMPPWTRTATGQYTHNKEFWIEAPAKLALELLPFKNVCARCMVRDARLRPTFDELLSALQALEASAAVKAQQEPQQDGQPKLVGEGNNNSSDANNESKVNKEDNGRTDNNGGGDVGNETTAGQEKATEAENLGSLLLQAPATLGEEADTNWSPWKGKLQGQGNN